MKTSHDEAAVHYGVSSFNLVIEYPPVRRLAKSSIRSNYLSVLIYYSEELYEGLPRNILRLQLRGKEVGYDGTFGVVASFDTG